MPSNSMHACTDCRVGGKAPYPACVEAGHKVLNFGSKITIPKKNNRRAWKRIEKGEFKWNRRKTRGKRGPDYYIGNYEYKEIPIDTDPCCDCTGCNLYRPKIRRVRIPGTGKQLVNSRRKPDVDLGG